MSPDDYLISYRQLIHDESKIGWWHWVLRECPKHVEYLHSKLRPKGDDTHAAANVLRQCRAGKQVEGESLTLGNVEEWFPHVHAQKDT